MYSIGGTECMNCAKNTFAPNSGSSSCELCPSGKTSEEGASSCEDIPTTPAPTVPSTTAPSVSQAPPAPAPSDDDDDDSGDSSTSSTPALIGAGVGAALIGMTGFFVGKRKKRSNDGASEQLLGDVAA